MEEVKLQIKGYKGYFVVGNQVYSQKSKKFLTPDNENRVRLYKNGTYRDYTVGKIVYCAQRGIDIETVPHGFEFFFNDGECKLDTKASRCSMRREQQIFLDIGRVMNDWRKMKNYLDIMLEYVEDEKKDINTAERRLREKIQESREDVIKYARSVLKLPLSKCVDYTDKSIDLCVYRMINFNYCIANPIGYIKKSVRGMMMRERLERKLQLNEDLI